MWRVQCGGRNPRRHTHFASGSFRQVHPSTGLSMADAAYGGGAAATPSVDSSVPCKDSRDTLYSFDEAKLDLIRKTKPWMQE